MLCCLPISFLSGLLFVVFAAVQLPSSHHKWSVLNSSVAQVDSLIGLTKALSLGVTTVVVEDTRVAGHIQGSSINVVTPDTFVLYMSPWSMSGEPTTESEPFPSSMHWYVVSGRQYLVQMKIFSGRPDVHEIYITEVFLFFFYFPTCSLHQFLCVTSPLYFITIGRGAYFLYL